MPAARKQTGLASGRVAAVQRLGTGPPFATEPENVSWR
jgi:hypothetical protein